MEFNNFSNVKPTLKSHTHLQFTQANATPKIAKEYVFANAEERTKK